MLFATDIPAAAAGLAAAYSFWKWLRAPGVSRMKMAGVMLGIALLCKLSMVILLPAWCIWWGVWCFLTPCDRVVQRTLQLAGILGLALFLVNLGYGFEGSLKPLKDYSFYSRALTGIESENPGHSSGNRFRDSIVGSVPVPFPQQYVIGIDTQKTYFDRGQPVFLNGKWYDRGFRSYYLFCVLYKWSLGTLILLGCTVVVTLGLDRYRVSLRDELFLLFSAVVLFALVSMNVSINKHIRYVVPAFPFLYIWISKLAMAFRLKDRWLSVALTVGLATTLCASLFSYPHSLSFFNMATGGPIQGHRLLAGTSIDWGQDLNYLRAWLDSHPEARPIGIEYSGVYKARDYRFECEDVPEGPSTLSEDEHPEDEIGPLPGWYAISLRSIHEKDSPFAYFWEFEPQARVGYSMRIYHITEEQANRVRKTMGLRPIGDAYGEMGHE